jgi:hypothetical protein
MSEWEEVLKRIIDLKGLAEESEKILALLRDDPPGRRLVITSDGKGGAGQVIVVDLGGKA